MMTDSVCLIEDSSFQFSHRESADHLTVTISSDLLIFRSEGFLTQPEKYIAMTSKGNTFVKASRMLIAKQFALENTV